MSVVFGQEGEDLAELERLQDEQQKAVDALTRQYNEAAERHTQSWDRYMLYAGVGGEPGDTFLRAMLEQGQIDMKRYHDVSQKLRDAEELLRRRSAASLNKFLKRGEPPAPPAGTSSVGGRPA